MTYLLFEHQGAFVLFGSKPLTEVILHPRMTEKDEEALFASLPVELQSKIKRIKAPYDPYACWELWKKKNYQIQDFIFTERPLTENSSSISVIILNIKNTTSLLQKNYIYLKNLFGKDFDPLVEVHTITNSQSPFWRCLFSDHYAKGLLFGYGETNARLFTKMVQGVALSWRQLKSLPIA